MTDDKTRARAVSETEARQVAEEARETEWQAPSFLKELFLGNFRLDLIHPFPEPPRERPQFRAFYDHLERFLLEEVDSRRTRLRGSLPETFSTEVRSRGAAESTGRPV